MPHLQRVGELSIWKIVDTRDAAGILDGIVKSLTDNPNQFHYRLDITGQSVVSSGGSQGQTDIYQVLHRVYRSGNRYVVFQALPHTLGLGPEVWRILAKCHERRNLGEYEGSLNINERLVVDLIDAAKCVFKALQAT